MPPEPAAAPGNLGVTKRRRNRNEGDPAGRRIVPSLEGPRGKAWGWSGDHCNRGPGHGHRSALPDRAFCRLNAKRPRTTRRQHPGAGLHRRPQSELAPGPSPDRGTHAADCSAERRPRGLICLEAVSEPWRHFFSIEAEAQRGQRFASLRFGLQKGLDPHKGSFETASSLFRHCGHLYPTFWVTPVRAGLAAGPERDGGPGYRRKTWCQKLMPSPFPNGRA
jgi:hypothetical protein